MVHSFDIEEAEIFGLYEAIILNHFRFWIAKNKANNRHLIEGKTWTYNSVRAFEELFPYLSKKQLRTTLESLIQLNILVKGNNNIKGYDRTLWYAFTDEDIINKKGRSIFPTGQMDFSSGAKGFSPTGEPIPVINQLANTDSFVSSKKKKLDVPPIYSEALDLHFRFYEFHNKIKPKMDASVGINLKKLLNFLKEASEEKTWESCLNLFRAILKHWEKLGDFYKGKEDINFIYSQIDRIINELRKKTGIGKSGGATNFNDFANNYM